MVSDFPTGTEELSSRALRARREPDQIRLDDEEDEQREDEEHAGPEERRVRTPREREDVHDDRDDEQRQRPLHVQHDAHRVPREGHGKSLRTRLYKIYRNFRLIL